MAVSLAPKPKAAAPKTARAPEPKPRHVPAPVPSPPKMPLFLSAPSANNMNHGAGGVGLAPPVQLAIENSLQVKLDSVRVHTDSYAHTANRNFSARAFTYGNHIFLGQGERATDLPLMAHEAAHVVQQQAAPRVQKWSSRESGDACEHEAHRASAAVLSGQTFPVRERTSTARVQRLGISDALNYFADHANLIPGFRMFTIVLGVNPINMTPVDRSAANIMRAVVEFIPGGALITQALDNYGIFDRVGTWVEQQIHTLAMTGSAIRHAIDDFLGSLSWRDVFHLGDVWDRARRIVAEPIDRLINFARGLVDGIVRFIKDAILRPLAQLASQTRGWDLLKAVLGRDPITGDPVPRTAETLIGGFMRLIGQEEVWQNIQRANAIPRAWAWFQGALEGLLGFVRQIPSMFVQALHELELADIVLLPRAFVRIGRVFAGFAVQFFSWAGQQVWNLLQIIFEVVAPGVMPYLRRAAGAFRTIVHNPIGFIRNLVRAGIQGFHQFAANFLTHLRASLISWLTGTLEGAGIYIPQGFTFIEIIKFVLSVLGLTWQNIRQKLVRRIGETAVRALEIGFDLVVTLVRDGPAAAWHKIQEHLSNLREMVMEQVMTFVRERIVQAAITRLVTSLNPAGAFIQAIIAIYNTIMFFVERLRQIAQVAAAFIDSISAIANGVITAAANRVEQTMAGLLTLVISFLARLVGLGRVSDVVVNTVNRIRAPVDQALDRVIDWIVERARNLVSRLLGGNPNAPAQERLNSAVDEAAAVVNRYAGRRVGAAVLRPLLAAIRLRYQLQSLEVIPEGGRWVVEGVVNPRRRKNTDGGVDGAEAQPAALDQSRITVGQTVMLRRERGVADTTVNDRYIWFVGTITRVDLTAGRERIYWRSANLSQERTGSFLFTEFNVRWRFGNEAQVDLSEDRMREENAKETWDTIVIARKVLNHRHHNAETNVAGKQWEHIVEDSAGGAHSSENLALTESTINNRLGTWFGQPYSNREAPQQQEGTGGRPLREYLRGKSRDLHLAWKQHAYTLMNLALSWMSSVRGRWQELLRR